MPDASTAVRAWINHNSGLTGRNRPLPQGAYLRQQRSPAGGAYAVLFREMGQDPDLVAEPGGPQLARVTAHVYAGSIEAAEAAAGALDAAWQTLAGRPQPCGTTGVTILTAANFTGPGFSPPAPGGGEEFMFETAADFVLYQT